jgi:hypothetical protein
MSHRERLILSFGSHPRTSASGQHVFRQSCQMSLTMM